MQYSIKPGGTGDIHNPLVLGVQIDINSSERGVASDRGAAGEP
jgi:hypothetical protein